MIGGVVIELKTIPKEERNSIICNLEYFSYLIWRKDTCLRVAHKTLIDIVGVKFEQELWVVLTHIGQAVRYDTDGYRLSFNDHHYSAANKRFGVKLSSRRMRDLLCILHDKNFITFYLGFYHKNIDSELSVVIVNDKILRLLNTPLLKTQGVKRNEPKDNIEVVDDDLTVTTKTYNTVKGKIDKRKFIVFRGTRGMTGITELKRNLKTYNSLIEKHKVTIDLGNGDKECNNIVYKRRFLNNLHTCGRYYTNSVFQTLPSESRKSIKIDGETTAELDIKSAHCAFLSTLDGIVFPDGFDCYTIPKLIDLGVTRDFTKGMLFPLLFSKSKSGAIKGIRLKLKEFGLAHISPDYMIECFVEHNPFIEEYLFSEQLYGELQYIDASIATLVIDYFTSKGIVVLCYHDSFVIQSKHKDELSSKMESSYLEVLGDTTNLVIREV